MKTIQETIDHLTELKGSPDICHACFDDPMCDDCFIGSAIHYLKQFQKIINIPEGESGEVTVTVKKLSRKQTLEQFIEDMKVLGYDEIQQQEDND